MASSIGLSIGDFKTVFDMLVKAYDAYKSSPQEFKGLLSEYKSLYAMVQCVHMAGDEHILDAKVKKKLAPLIRDCNRTARHLRRFLGQYPSLTGRPNAREKINFAREDVEGWISEVSQRKTSLTFIQTTICGARTKKSSPRKGLNSRKASKGPSLLSISNRTVDSEPSSRNRLRVAVPLPRRDSIQDVTRTGETAITSHNAAQVAQPHTCMDHGIDILEAAQQQDWRKVKRLISAIVELSSPQFHLSLTFQLAIQSSAWDIVQILVSKGIDPNGKSLNRRPAILVAALAEAWSVVKLLAQRGADLSVTNSNGHTVLLLAALCRKWDMVDFLASAGADIKVKGTFLVYSQITVLSYAATHKDWIHVEQLLNRGADPNSLTLNGDPILVAAAAQQQWSTVGALLEKDVYVNEPGRGGKTALTHVLSSMRSTTENPRKFENVSRILRRLVLKGAIFGRKELELCSNGTIGEEIWRCMLTPENLAADLSFSS
ncbi:ankyrin repeat-containing domain protein [Aspergillus sergii]|uniref:Ankyrin repeat-containing domain protein n=1 Tax=Aspergillus sergii TaxID=1034303 RepID=A0A5N6XH82_9EURO|nr:ankyrin repeat-containing domain protein [Aspergillus sergii]